MMWFLWLALFLETSLCTNSSESLAWQALYNATDGQNWYRCSGVDSTPCDCSLVICDGNGSVVKIDLQANTLQGYLPDQIGDFASLTHLDVSFNHLSGGFPASLFALSALSYLDVSSNLMNGSIPPLQNTSMLEVLVLANNRFTGCFPRPLPALSSLSVFRIDRNAFATFLHPETVNFILKQNSLRLAYLISNAAPSNQIWCPVPNYTEMMNNGILAGGCVALAYRDNPVTYTLTGAEHPDPIKPNVPNFVTNGCELTFEANPALPPGLKLNPATGVISGTAQQPLAASMFVIHASDGQTSTSVQVSITIIGSVLNSARYDVLLVMLGLIALATAVATAIRKVQAKKRAEDDQVVPVPVHVSRSQSGLEHSLPLNCRLVLAGICLRDGREGRKLAKIDSTAQFQLYLFLRSNLWEAVIFFSSCGYLLLSIPEFDYQHTTSAGPWLIVIEVLLLVIQVVDIYLSWKFLVSFSGRLLDGSRAIVVFLSVLDLVLHYGWTAPRFCRALRPLLLILRWHPFRKQVFGILSALPRVFGVMCVIGVFIFCAAFVGFLLFDHIPGLVPFSTLGDAVWNLFLVNAVLAYALNLLSPILLDDDSAVIAMWFFLLFILFTNYFLLKLIVSYTNASFTVYAAANDEQKKQKQKQAYQRAFELLDESQKNEVTLPIFLMLAKIVQPILDETVCMTIFRAVVKNRPTIQTAEEFTTLAHILVLNIKRAHYVKPVTASSSAPSSPRISTAPAIPSISLHPSAALGAIFNKPRPSDKKDDSDELVEENLSPHPLASPLPATAPSAPSAWTRARKFVRLCCKFSVPLRVTDALSMNVRPLRVLVRSMVLVSTIQIWLTATQVHDGHVSHSVQLLGKLLAFFFAIELLLKVFSAGLRRSQLAELAWTVAAFLYTFWSADQSSTPFSSILLVISFTRVSKLLRGFSQTSKMLQVLDEALWDAMLLMVVYTLLLYSFNCLAMGLYSDVLVSSTTDTRIIKTNWYLSYRTALNFESFPRGLFTMFCCSVMGGRWMDVMTAAVQASEAPDFLAYLLFVAFRIICTMMFLPLSTGMLLQVFLKSQNLVAAKKGVVSKTLIHGAGDRLYLFSTARVGVALPSCLINLEEVRNEPSIQQAEQKEQKEGQKEGQGLKAPLLMNDDDD